MAFVLQDVINEIEETRSLDPLKKLKKENLVKVAAHYGITPAVGATKSHILNLIKDHCVEHDIIDEVEEKPIAETAEIVRLKLDFEREERRLAREAEKALQDAQFAEAQRAREEAQKAREAAEAEAQRARDLRLAELKEARELRELELKAEQEKALLAAEIEAKKEAAAREHELKMASLGKQSPSDKASAFDPARNIRLVPPFQEKEVDKYFAHFEKVADSLNWPKESWVLLLQSVLVGKAQKIYGSLSVEQSSNYEHVKEAILKAYELVPEAYRQKFRNYLKYDSKTHVEFAREKENLFNRWCHSKEIGQDFKKLKQMVLLEEFKDKVRPDIRSHLDEQKVEELEKAAIMADDYALTHKMSSKSGNPQQKRYHGSGNRENISRNMDDRKRQGKSTENVGLVSKVEPLKPISCGHCGKPGHIITNCWKLGGKTPCEHCGRFNHKSEDCRIAKNKLQKEVKPTGLTSLKGLKVSPFNESENLKGVKVKPLIDQNNFVEKNKGIKVNPLHNDKSCIEDEISPNTESDYMENYKPFISEGVVSLVGDENSSQKVKILRDTGATQSLMLDSVLPLTENSFTGANVLISAVEMGVLEVPLHEVNIKSSLINGNIVIGMRPSLPVEGISLILGNDLAGEKVMVDPRVVEKPRDDEETERLAEKFPGIFPASVVTRSMKAKKEAIKEQGKEEIGLSGTFLENIDVKFEERNKEKADKALMRNESRNVKENIPEKQESESKSVISRQNLIVEQSNDIELLDLFKIALTPVQAEKVSVGYLIKENILMRKWSSHCVTIGPLLLLKEKWLDEDPEKISVLKYVATFKDRLFRAGQIAKRNLQESQSKMKVWYDRKAKSRCFEPGDRVLVLFPVVGNPLQAKYSGPYKVVKKISDTNYLVKTPGRRKETQVCHINMLKAYHEKPKPELVTLNNRLGLESPTHSKDCVGQVAEKEEDTESEVRLGNDQQPIKLQNSQILNGLGTKLSHLPLVQRKELAEVITQYREVFPDVPSKTNLIEHDVDVGDSAPIKQHPYRLSPMKKELLDKEVQYMLKNDIIEESQSNWSSPCILVPKHDGGFRFCTDFRKVNDKTKSDSFPIPRIADCIDQIGNAKFVSTFDMLKGYWQVPLTQRAREISAFVTPSGLYQYKVMPFGMKNAPATFQRMVNKLVRDIDGCEGYIDDVVIFSDNWSDHIRQIERFFQIMREAKLTINLMKSEFGKATVKYLGHIVGQGQVRPLDAKIQTIVKYPIPTSRKELARFLGMAGYYRNFCLNFSEIAAPLTNLLSKKVKFVWTDDCQMAFDKVKLLLQKSPVLKSPDYEKPFKLIIDSSDVGTGSVLLQEASDGLDHPVSYFSKKFLKYQKNYSVVEKETLGLVLALEHFDVYLGSTPFKIKVYTDHNPLTFLKTMKNKNQRLVRWSLALQEYNLEIQHIPGSENVVADALSRCIG